MYWIKKRVPAGLLFLSLWQLARQVAFAQAVPAPAQGTGDTDVSTQVPRGMLDIIFAGGWVGDSIMILLFALSLTAAYLAFKHLLTIRKGQLSTW